MKRLLFFGDVVGRPGRAFLIDRLPFLRDETKADFLVANAENSAAGSGVTGKIARELLDAGIDAITLGDHVWDQKTFIGEIGGFDRVCRPANLAPACPGRRFLILEKNGFRLAVFTVLTRVFMHPCGDPFAECEALIAELRGHADAIVVEVHGEATSEKVALGWALDGKVAAVLGTHTHIPTADAEVRPGGAAYITDIGMTGPYRSVLGREIEAVVARFRDGMPRHLEVAEQDVRICAAQVDIDEASGLARDIRLIVVRKDEIRYAPGAVK